MGGRTEGRSADRRRNARRIATSELQGRSPGLRMNVGDVRPRRLPMPSTVADAAVVFAYRCGGSAGLVMHDLGRVDSPASRFNPQAASRRHRVTLKRAQCT